MPAKVSTVSLNLPRKYESYSVGFAIDIGGSVTKLVYRERYHHNEADGKNGVATKSRMRIALMDRDDIDTLVDFIKDNVDLPKEYLESLQCNKTTDLACITTGVGVIKYTKDLKKRLNIECTNINEFAMIGKAFKCFTEYLSLDEIFAPVSRKAFDRSYLISTQRLKGAEKMAKQVGGKTDIMGVHDGKLLSCDEMYADYCRNDNPVFPCMIMVMGSASSLNIVTKDGVCQPIDFTTVAGKTFMGLGELCTGAQSYDELAELASRGSYTKCTSLMKDLFEGGESDLYSVIPMDAEAYTFGKIIGHSKDARKEDIAATLLQMIFEYSSSMAVIHAEQQNINNVYFIGSMLKHDTVRDALTFSFLTRTHRKKDQKIKMRVIDMGAYYPAFGAWINGWEEEQQ